MQRKLTAILSADVVGYSGMMEADEAGTMERLKANRTRIFDPQVAIHGGRQFKLMGDGALVDFVSVIAAVNCALAIQEATERARTDDASAKPLRYRIGINLGEVIVEGDDIYGDGVNVAARIQTLAPEGGVALSKMVRDNVEGKMTCVFDDMGEHTVKNIERPVHVFSVRAAVRSESEGHKVEEARKLSICVLPFANMSGDTEQEYFSDGISEDIITDLSKVSALSVVSRNSAFLYKGKHVDLPKVARELKVSHVLEGSVRKSSGRVRITAQLIDGATNDHVWAERYDRDLNDIFALQDEISEAIVKALRLKLLPEEKKAIEQRSTTSADAYKFYLMARQYSIAGNYGDARRGETIIRICRRATEIDPSYARAWALMANTQRHLRFLGLEGDDGLAAAERAIALDNYLSEAHAAKAAVLMQYGRSDEAHKEIEIALRLDPDCYEDNYVAARWNFSARQLRDAISYWEKASNVMEADFASGGMQINCYMALGEPENARRAARRTLARTEKIAALYPENGSAMSFGVTSLAVLGETERAKEWAERAVLFDPDNKNLRYNLACTFVVNLREFETALDLLEPLFTTIALEAFNWTKVDPDLDAIREDPRFKTMLAAAESRLAAEEAAASESHSA